MPAATDQERFLDVDFGRVAGHLDTGPLAGKRIFVTGGTGFFGLWLLTAFAHLVARGTHLEVFVLSRDPNRFLLRFPHFRNVSWLSFVTGDVTNYRWPPGPFDFFIHAATETSARAHRDPLTIFDTIVSGTRRALDHAVEANAQRFLLVSSGAVYGAFPANIQQVPESAPFACDPLIPGHAYGESKRSAEMLSALYRQRYGIGTVVARGFAFVGPGLPLDGHFAIGNFIRDAIHAPEILVKGNGSPIRSYLYGADLAVWLLTILTKGATGCCYNLGSDEGIGIRELAHLVRDLLAPGTPVRIMGSLGTSEPRQVYVPDISRARHDLKLDVWTPLATAILGTAHWNGLAGTEVAG